MKWKCCSRLSWRFLAWLASPKKIHRFYRLRLAPQSLWHLIILGRTFVGIATSFAEIILEREREWVRCCASNFLEHFTHIASSHRECKLRFISRREREPSQVKKISLHKFQINHAFSFVNELTPARAKSWRWLSLNTFTRIMMNWDSLKRFKQCMSNEHRLNRV